MVTFLIADNSKIVLEVLEFTLDQADFEVYSATNAAQVEQILATHRVDFILLDQNLGGEDAIELAREVLEANKHIKILVMSNTQSVEEKRRAKKVGVVGWILKPFIPSHLIRMIIKTFLDE